MKKLFNLQALTLGLSLAVTGMAVPANASDVTPENTQTTTQETSFAQRLRDRLHKAEIGDVRFFLENGQYEKAMDAIRKKDAAGQTDILATAGVVWKLAKHGQAEAIVEIISTLEPTAQKEILATDNVVWGLADNGQAACILDLIDCFKREEQKDILLAFGTIVGLVGNGEAGAVIALIQKQDADTQKQILLDPGIVDEFSRHGYGHVIKDMTDDCAAPGPLHGRSLHRYPPYGCVLRDYPSVP